jgi:hypothetical protein
MKRRDISILLPRSMRLDRHRGLSRGCGSEPSLCDAGIRIYSGTALRETLEVEGVVQLGAARECADPARRTSPWRARHHFRVITENAGVTVAGVEGRDAPTDIACVLRSTEGLISAGTEGVVAVRTRPTSDGGRALGERSGPDRGQNGCRPGGGSGNADAAEDAAT